MILMIDNYDSFTYNIVQYCLELGANLKIIRNDELTIDEIKELNPEKRIEIVRFIVPLEEWKSKTGR